MIQNFNFIETMFKGAYIITPFYSGDNRGCLIKDFNINVFNNNNIDHQLKEVFYTVSKKGVIRAMHCQIIKQQAKLVRCIKGHIYDVIVDLRKESPTYGKWQGFDLSDDNNCCVYIPEDFAHGYLVLEDSIVSYKCNEVFYGEYDTGFLWSDEYININWPLKKIGGVENIIISEKDLRLKRFREFEDTISNY